MRSVEVLRVFGFGRYGPGFLALLPDEESVPDTGRAQMHLAPSALGFQAFLFIRSNLLILLTILEY